MNKFKNILCVVEPTEDSESALERAITLAEKNQANVTVVNVVERAQSDLTIHETTPVIRKLQIEIEKAHERQMEKIVEPFRGRLKIRSEIVIGVPYVAVIREVLRHGHDLVIKPMQTTDWVNRLFGGNDMQLLRYCPCPVWLMKPGHAKSYRRILAAVDVSDEGYPQAELKVRQALNQQVVATAASLAALESAELHLVYAWAAVEESVLSSLTMQPDDQLKDYIDETWRKREQAVASLISEIDQTDLKIYTHFVKGRARKEIPVTAKDIDADLIVMGTVARTGIPGFVMGNTAEQILSHIDCSVLAIKPSSFVTPITL